jgi:hypothetical protein
LKGTYVFKEFDGTWLKGIYIGNRLKKFVYKKDAFTPANIDDNIDFIVSSLLKQSDSWEEDMAEDEELPWAAINMWNIDR